MDKFKAAENLVKLRKSKNISRKKFAEDLHISYSTACSYETGERVPRDEIKKKIADYYNTTVQAIFFNH